MGGLGPQRSVVPCNSEGEVNYHFRYYEARDRDHLVLCRQ
jgi:hypothetical protein